MALKSFLVGSPFVIEKRRAFVNRAVEGNFVRGGVQGLLSISFQTSMLTKVAQDFEQSLREIASAPRYGCELVSRFITHGSARAFRSDGSVHRANPCGARRL